MSHNARAARRPKLGELVSTARLNFTRVPPRKARIVCDLIRGLDVESAQHQLRATHRPSAEPTVSRLLASALANARGSAEAGSLIIGDIQVNSGPMLKRFRPRAMGRACTIRKRLCHITIKLFTEAQA